MPQGGKIEDRPANHDIQADLWEIRVTISVSLPSYLDEPNHGHQHANVPQPTYEKVWPLFSNRDASRCDACENHQRENDLPKR